MTVQYFVFTDRREAVGEDGPLSGQRPGDSVDMLDHLQGHDWKHPYLVVFRETEDKRWSFSLIHPSKRQERLDEASG